MSELSERMVCNQAKGVNEYERLPTPREAKGEKESFTLDGEGEISKGEIRIQGETLMKIREIKSERTVHFIAELTQELRLDLKGLKCRW